MIGSLCNKKKAVESKYISKCKFLGTLCALHRLCVNIIYLLKKKYIYIYWIEKGNSNTLWSCKQRISQTGLLFFFVCRRKSATTSFSNFPGEFNSKFKFFFLAFILQVNGFESRIPPHWSKLLMYKERTFAKNKTVSCCWAKKHIWGKYSSKKKIKKIPDKSGGFWLKALVPEINCLNAVEWIWCTIDVVYHRDVYRIEWVDFLLVLFVG